ncbi:hypothetical protein ABEB36_008536 [Hypothenemus hampei]|uniref:Nucleolar pre-ribosomal-associated protein 1 n=1 Tax=Hypothenemus hampei TaxID=57062 RepID=A0ABD1EM79_HYPHA
MDDTTSEVFNNKKRTVKKSLDNDAPKQKKSKLSTVKQIRKQLHSVDKLGALKEFTMLISENPKHDYILDFLKDGGNCLELLQTLEGDSTIPPSIVFGLITEILLRISAKYGQYHNSAYESCRYLINNYLPVVHKMLGLSSSKDERKISLKLLIAIITFSSTLAKDVLINVKLHSANIELLTKHTGEKNSVRDHFIQFLTAFLVDADIHNLSVLLERSNLLTSIIPGLQYDNADTVCLVTTALKNHILENPLVRKTTKMHVFNTAVVKDIVNLYNWKGPEGLKALEKNNKISITVDKIAKSKVSECIHDFLLVLCTSHKFGLIFHDHLVGLGRKHMNSLMYTVLDSLDRPWDHSYASDLVLKICRSCPDLAKNMWLILKPYLEPRYTEKWLNAMNFAQKLIVELQPSCINYCIKELTSQQFAQIIEILVSPSPVLRTVLEINSSLIKIEGEEKVKVKIHILKLLSQMLESIEKFIAYIKSQISEDNISKVKQYLSNYIIRQYPKPENLLEDWYGISDTKINETETSQEYLETVLDIFNFYKTLAPQLILNLSSSGFDFKDFLFKLPTISEDNNMLKIKLIGIFVDIDSSYFLPKTDVFSHIVSIVLKNYHTSKSKEIHLILYKLLRNASIFDNNVNEINIWINGIFNIKTLSDNFVTDFNAVIKNTSERLLDYQKELLDNLDEKNIKLENEDIINNILNLGEFDDDQSERPLKPTKICPTILGLFKYCLEQTNSKHLRKYLEFIVINLFHSQTDWKSDQMALLLSLIQKYHEVIPSNVLNYINNCAGEQVTPLIKIKGSLTQFQNISEHFINGNLTLDMLKESPYPNFLQDVLRMSTFYFSSLLSKKLVSENHINNWKFVIDAISESNEQNMDEACLNIIFENPCFVKHFKVISSVKEAFMVTNTIYDIFVYVESKGMSLDCYKHHYCIKICGNIERYLKHPKKNFVVYEEISKILKIFALTYNQSTKLLNTFSHLPISNITDDNVTLNLLVYCFGRIIELCKMDSDLKPVKTDLLSSLTEFSVEFNKKSSLNNQNAGLLAKTLHEYFTIFPYSIAYVHRGLFQSCLNISEYNKDIVDLAVFLLQKDLNLVQVIESTNMSSICEKKGLILPIVHVLVNNQTSENFLKQIYEHLESSIIKAIQKPQKVGQHFLKNYDIPYLINKFMSIEKCINFIEKVQKFEISELFHAKLIGACFEKVLKNCETTEKQVNNIIITFVHLLLNVLKKKMDTQEETTKVSNLCIIFDKVLTHVGPTRKLPISDSIKTFTKFALKYGISGVHILLSILRKLINNMSQNMTKEDANLLLEMLLSHSEFLNIVLGENSSTKYEVLTLILQLCENWNELMEKSHVAVLLAAYTGLVNKCDRTTLKLLKLYESKPDQTSFYDFKPFLWGKAAAIHYSIRNQIGNSLNRQPKISDLLGILKEDLLNSTIVSFPLTDHLRGQEDAALNDLNCYDIKFFLPLFSHILAPEQQVKTYVFIRSGALSLTLLGLACGDEEVRQASCHVLSRFHFHLEARQTGKDNLLWIRFVEALCKGVALLPHFKLNNFSAIFFARMALILSNPKHVMFTPLSLYLTCKEDLNLGTVPELYTLLFSSDVNFKDHRNFILEILSDGMRTEKDFFDFLKSMGYKQLSELYSSCLSDADSKTLILEVINSICKIPAGVKILIENYSLLPQLNYVVNDACSKGDKINSIPKLFSILLNLLKSITDLHTCEFVFELCTIVDECKTTLHLKEKDMEAYYEILYTVVNSQPSIVRDKREFVKKLLSNIKDRFCNYLQTYGCSFVNENCEELIENHPLHFLRLLVFKLLS